MVTRLFRLTLVLLACSACAGLGACDGSVSRPPADGDAGPNEDGDAGVQGDDGQAWDGGDPGADQGGDPGGDPGGDQQPGECGQIVTIETGRQPAQQIHVAEGGSDQDGDGSPDKPFGTIRHAVDLAQPGTAVVIHAGSYPGGLYLEGVQGTEQAPIWLGGAPGEARPVIEGGNQAMHITRPRYLIVHDLEARNQTQNGINCDDGGYYADPDAARYVVFRGLSIHDVGSGGNEDCLKLSGLDDYWVLDSELARCGGGMSGSGVDHVGCHAGVLAGNRFEQNSGNAIQCKGGSVDIDIRHNWLVEPGERGVNMGGSTGFEFFRPPLSPDAPNAEARRITVQANVIIGGTAALAFVGCVDCLAANNTIVDPHNWIFRILQETNTTGGYTFEACRDNAVVNNLVWFDRSDLSTYVNIGDNTAPDTFTFANNLWFARDAPGQSEPGLPVAESDGLYGQDPQLTDPAGRDFSIPSGSPAHGSGLAWPGLIDADMDGTCYADPPSRGAYEVP